ncbi:MAG: HPr-rel-A system PqqD family peptide chaperone [Deferrisomatales bacterium]
MTPPVTGNELSRPGRPIVLRRLTRPGLLRRTWEEETVVFNPLSGEIHLLNESAAAALDFLATDPADGPELAARVAKRLGLQRDPELTEHMTRLIWELDELGLLQAGRQ